MREDLLEMASDAVDTATQTVADLAHDGHSFLMSHDMLPGERGKSQTGRKLLMVLIAAMVVSGVIAWLRRKNDSGEQETANRSNSNRANDTNRTKTHEHESVP